MAAERGGRTGNDPTGRTAGQESVFDAGLLPSPLGNDPSGTGRYDNSLVYMLCLFAVLFVPLFGPIAIAAGVYRVGKGRPHAWRGVWIACAATAVGLWLLGLALTT